MALGTITKFRRVVVSMDPSSDPKVALTVASELAIAANAELFGHFVEENALIDISSLPFARGIHSGGNKAQSLSRANMEIALQRQAAAFEKALSVSAGEARLTWNFKASRGDFFVEVQSATSETDLIIFQSTPTGFTALDFIEDARRIASKALGVVICVDKKSSTRGPIVVLDDGDRAGIETVRLSKKIATSKNVPIVLCVLAPTSIQADSIADRDLEEIGYAVPVTLRKFVAWELTDICDAFREIRPSYVVGDLQGEPFKDNESASRLIRAAQTPVILVNPKV